jgi:poly-beta-1,6-N-acetyl-D-glucosamine synthase
MGDPASRAPLLVRDSASLWERCVTSLEADAVRAEEIAADEAFARVFPRTSGAWSPQLRVSTAGSAPKRSVHSYSPRTFFRRSARPGPRPKQAVGVSGAEIAAYGRPYVLVTAARNERDYLQVTLDSVVAQTVKPQMWVIVSDGSTDGTDDLVRSYATHHSLIHLCRIDAAAERNTAAKVNAIRIGLKVLTRTHYAYIGNLDADISFGERYFETLIGRFESDAKLGVIGVRIFEVDARGRPREAKSSLESVAGAVQFFRRECFDQIGGYRPLAGGMEDGIAEISARYYGWKSRSYPDLPVLHHREVGTVGRSLYEARFTSGVTEYAVGFGFAYHVLRALSRIFERPYVLGSALIVSGYLWARLSRKPKVVPAVLIGFIRREQRLRLLSRLRRRQAAA